MNKIKQEAASKIEFRSQEINGNGDCTPPNMDPAPVRMSVYRGVVVPRTCSPGLNVNPFPARMLREYLNVMYESSIVLGPGINLAERAMTINNTGKNLRIIELYD
jgi:hypothetical protein